MTFPDPPSPPQSNSSLKEKYIQGQTKEYKGTQTRRVYVCVCVCVWSHTKCLKMQETPLPQKKTKGK